MKHMSIGFGLVEQSTDEQLEAFAENGHAAQEIRDWVKAERLWADLQNEPEAV